MKEKILSIIREICNEIGETYKQNQLLTDYQNYNKCYSSIYLLEDIAESFDFYKTKDDKSCSLGEKYILIYGIFEALYLQQDALKTLFLALNIQDFDLKKDFPEINYIRNIRNDIAGHPTNRGTHSTYLSRPDLSLKKIKYEESKEHNFIDVDVISCIKKQEKFIVKQLQNLLELLLKEKKEHIEHFKSDKMLDCFKMFCYANEKVYVENKFYTKEDALGFKLVEEMLSSFMKKVDERFVSWKNTHFSYEIEQVQEIYGYLLSKDNLLNEVDKESKFLKRQLLENLFTHLKRLYEIAKEIDEKYENYFEDKFRENNTQMSSIKVIDNITEEIGI